MITFQLNGVNVNVEVAPKIIETLDESLDSASVVLEANENENPIEPMTPFTINKDGEIISMYVASDSVEVYSTTPLRFKHTLSLIQSSRRLNKLLVRNSVFTQPPQKVRKAYWSMAQLITGIYEDPEHPNVITNVSGTLKDMNIPEECSTPLSLDSREKIKGIPYIIITYQAGIRPSGYSSNTISETFENKPLSYMRNKFSSSPTILINGNADNETPENTLVCYIYYKDSNNQEQGEPIYLTDVGGGVIVFNEPIYIPKIKTILEAGGHDLYVSTAKKTRVVIGKESLGSWDSYASFFTRENCEDFYCYPEEHDSPGFIFIQMQTFVETYYNTAYDILSLLNTRQKQLTGIGQKNVLTYTLNPSSTTGKLLKKTIAPNFSFTQCTMYECVAEVFRLFDATFRLKNDGELEIEYLNTSETASTIANTDFSGENRSISDDRYNSGLISYYQDARVKEVFPVNNDFVRATSSALGVPDEGDHCFLLPHNIDNIISVKAKILTWHAIGAYPEPGPVAYQCNIPITVDITPYVVEESVWSLLNTTNDFPLNNDYREVTQKNSIFYTKGSNKIDIAYSFQTGWFGQTNWAFGYALKSALIRMSGNSYKFSQDGGTPSGVGIGFTDPTTKDYMNCFIQVEYETTVDGRVKSESIVSKYNGETLIDQYNGSVDLNKMGLNMMGLSLKLGEPTLNATHKITSWNNRIKKGMVYVDNDGKKWVANVCSYTFLDDDTILGEISFTANYNALSLRTKLNRERRMTNISKDLVTKSEDNYVDYIYYSQEDYNNLTEEATAINLTTTMIGGFFPSEYTPIPKTEIPEMGVIYYLSHILTGYCDYIPLIKYNAGNSLCFEMSYTDPMIIGQNTSMKGGWFAEDDDEVNYTEVVKYADNNGFVDSTNFMLINSDVIDNTNKYPNIKLKQSPATVNCIAKISNYAVHKQPNEIMALNYQLVFLPIESEKNNIFLGRAFYDNNFLVNEVGSHKFYIHYGYGKYDILDTEIIDGDDPTTEIIEVSGISVANNKRVTFSHTGILPPANATCWCLADENDQIYIMCNTVKHQSSQSIRFYKRLNRLKL